MNTRVTITLPDEVYHRAESLAHRTRRDVADVLADTLMTSLPAADEPSSQGGSVANLPDEELLALAELAPPSDQDRRFSTLLDKQQACELTPAERAELFAFMQIYQHGLLLKARALREAVRRGLRPPLES
jgi:hypothetical protein